MAVAASQGSQVSPAWLEIEIETIRQLTPSVKSFAFKVPWGYAFYPGQCVDFRLTAYDGYQAQRYYSIATAPSSEGLVEVLVERRTEGEVSSFFHDEVRSGDHLEVRGPIGGGPFTWRPSDPGPVLLIGGGSGVSPLLSIIRHHALSGCKTPLTLFYSARKNNEIIARDELIALSEQDGSFQLLIAVTQEAPAHKYFINRRLGKHHFRTAMSGRWANPATSFICGSNGFVGDCSDILLEEGLDMHQIRTERFGG